MENGNYESTVIENLLITLYRGEIAKVNVPRTKATAWINEDFRQFIFDQLGIELQGQQFRDIVNSIRKQSLIPILGTRGYWFSQDPYEVKEYIAQEKDGYIKTTMDTIKCLKRHLPQYKNNTSALNLPTIDKIKPNLKIYGEFVDAMLGGKTKYPIPTKDAMIKRTALDNLIANEFKFTHEPDKKGRYFGDTDWQAMRDYIKVAGDYPLLSKPTSDGGYYTGGPEEIQECIKLYGGKVKSHMEAILGLKVFEPKERVNKLF